MIRLVRSTFFLLLGLGALLMTADKAWRWKNREKFDYLDVKIWTAGDHISRSVRGKEKEEVKKLIEELAKDSKTVWLGAPQLSDCPLELWDAWEEEFYSVCRGKDGKWYVQLPGSSRGRSTERYFAVEGERVKDVIDKVTALLTAGSY